MSIMLSKLPAVAASARKKKTKKKQHFPGDPRFEIALSVLEEDVTSLLERKMLNTNLLDFLIQQAAPSSNEKNQPDFHLGSLGVHRYILSSNQLLEDESRHSRQIKRIRSKVDELVYDDSQKTMIFPIIEACHFYVVVIGLQQVVETSTIRCIATIRFVIRDVRKEPTSKTFFQNSTLS